MTEGVTLCPHCQHDNHEGAKFCSACGAKLGAICPQCGQGNPPGSRFCNECGLNLEEALSKGQHQELERQNTPQTIASKRKIKRGLVALYGIALAGVLLYVPYGVYVSHSNKRVVGYQYLWGEPLSPMAQPDIVRIALHAAAVTVIFFLAYLLLPDVLVRGSLPIEKQRPERGEKQAAWHPEPTLFKDFVRMLGLSLFLTLLAFALPALLTWLRKVALR